jgi:2,3,4,5-tetrahydropyridine-2-carboxylate N-succinyltransferase
LAAGVILTGGSVLHDLVHGRELSGSSTQPLEIPENAVVIPGTRALEGEYATSQGLSAACALIVKYRDASTDAATALEDAVR